MKDFSPDSLAQKRRCVLYTGAQYTLQKTVNTSSSRPLFIYAEKTYLKS